MEPLRGSQEPTYEWLPPADDSDDLADRAVALAELAGLTLDPWQQRVLRGIMRRDEGKHFAAFESCLLVPRQNGKSLTLEAFDLAKLFLSPPGHLILHTAHQFKTARESFLHLVGLLNASDELKGEVERIRASHGEEGIELRNGSRLLFSARTVSGAGRGFSPDSVVLDEAYRLPQEALAALMPALSARPNPQLVYASSTGYPESEILWSLVQRGRRGGDGSLYYAEWCMDPDGDLSDPLQWAKANPALGYRLTEKKIAAEWSAFKDRMGGPEEFGRERGGLWAESSLQRIFPAGSWENCGDVDSRIDGSPHFAVAISTDRQNASIAACGDRSDGLNHVEIVQIGTGTDWIQPELVDVTRRNGGSVVIDPASPAGTLVDDLKRAGVKVHTVTAQKYAQACGSIYDAVQNKELRHLDEEVLNAAVAGATTRTLAGGFAWDLSKPRTDITPLVAVTLARWGHQTYGGNIAEAIW